MQPSENELRELLNNHSIDTRSLRLLWEIDAKQVYGLTVPGAEAINQWHTLRQLTEESKYYPLLLGEEENIDGHIDSWDAYDTPDDRIKPNTIESTIRLGDSLNAEKCFQARSQELYDDMCDYKKMPSGDPLEIVTNLVLGKWKNKVSPNNCFYIPYRRPRNGDFLETVEIALIPTQTCWHIPAYLNFGAWNDCPHPEEHVCLMKRWHELYGAEVVGITHDVVEMYINKPPLTKEDAIALAKEQYLYCSDIVDQGTQTLSALAGNLLNGSAWFFWWD